jgi:hypothetical protein
MVPGTDHEDAAVALVDLLQGFVDLQRAVEVLLVPPAGHVQRGHGDAREVRRHRLPLPERVVVGMAGEVVPRGPLSLEEPGVHVREGAEREIPLIGVVAIELEVLDRVRGLEGIDVFEAVAQAEGAVVVEVVADPHVGRGGLGRDGLDGGMRVQHRHHGEPAAVGDAEDADAAVARDVLQDPLDRVVRVGRLVDRARVALVADRPQHHELSLGLRPSPDVLEHEDVAVLGQLGVVGPEGVHEALLVVGQAVGRPRQQDRKLLPDGLRHVDLGVEPDAVAHPHHRLDLVEGQAGVRRGLGSGQGREQHEPDGQQASHEGLL